MTTMIFRWFMAFALIGAIASVASIAASAVQQRPLRIATPASKKIGEGDLVIHTFGTSPNASDGANPAGNLLSDATGDLYGTTQGGGNGNGVVFEFVAHAHSGSVYTYTETVLYTFTGGTDGSHPIGGLVADSSGALYGTTPSGGSNRVGVVFKLTPPPVGQSKWTYTVLHTFGTSPGLTDGATPKATLLWLRGALYGTTENGGTAGYGVVFKLAQSGASWAETVLHSFATSLGASDGANPTAGLIADNAGNLYGTTQGGGVGSGVAFALTPSGSSWNETVLHTFGTSARSSDGAHPAAPLVFGPGNGLYGTTMSGGSGNAGVAFGLLFNGTTWAETVLHAFGTASGSSDGATPMSGLTAAGSGAYFAFFGTTFAGGKGYGVVYELDPPQNGTSWLELADYDFESHTGDGANPVAGLTLANSGFNGALGYFGTTEGGGNGYGTLYTF